VAITADEDVFGLQITVDDTCGMKTFATFDDFCSIETSSVSSEPAPSS
jgi:hypothetical protein